MSVEKVLNEVGKEQSGVCGSCGRRLNVAEKNAGSNIWCQEVICVRCKNEIGDGIGVEAAISLVSSYKNISNLGNVVKESAACLSVASEEDLSRLAAALKKRSKKCIQDLSVENTVPISTRDNTYLLLDDARILRLFPETDLARARTFVRDSNEGRGLYEAFEGIELRIRGDVVVEEARPKVEGLSLQSMMDVEMKSNACATACVLRPLYFNFKTMHAVSRCSRSASLLFQDEQPWRAVVLQVYPKGICLKHIRNAFDWRTYYHLQRLKDARSSMTTHLERNRFQPVTKLCLSRLMREAHEMLTSGPQGISACPSDAQDLTKWKATIFGPDNSPYAQGIFRLDLSFPPNYPIVAPRVKFLTKIFHPNIDQDSGAVCCDLLEPNAWSAAASIRVLLLSIQSLLTSPTADDSNSPANAEAAHLFHTDHQEFLQVVANYVQAAKIQEGTFSQDDTLLAGSTPTKKQTPTTKKQKKKTSMISPSSKNSTPSAKKPNIQVSTSSPRKIYDDRSTVSHTTPRLMGSTTKNSSSSPLAAALSKATTPSSSRSSPRIM